MSTISGHLSRTMVFAFVLCATWQPSLAFPQEATPTPSATEEDADEADSEVSAFVEMLMVDALENIEQKDYAEAIESLQYALMHAEVDGLQDDIKVDIQTRLASTLFTNEDYLDAVHVLNALSSTHPDPKWLLLRAAAYHKAGWRIAMLDELRNALRLYPNSISIRQALADELLSSQGGTSRNAKEALALLTPLKAFVDAEPRYAKLIALAASETGDFERAVQMQKIFLQSDAPHDQDAESKILSLYEHKMIAPTSSPPAFDASKLLSDEELANVARRSMVKVRVTREVELQETETGLTANFETGHMHIGTVLSSMGTILVSSETVRPPRFEDISAKEVKGTAKLLNDQVIEVFTMPTDLEDSQFLGKARVQGYDEASGLAVLEIVREKKLHQVKLEGLSSVQFMPEHRALDPHPKAQLSRTLELPLRSGDTFDKPTLNEVTADFSQYSAYHDWTQNAPTMARMASIADSEGPVGTPFFNQLGECVGVSHQVGFGEKSRQVGIPSAVCSRIAAKLMADGEVHRAYLPFTKGGSITGVQEPSMGMMVTKLGSPDPVYAPLEGKTIASLDGVETPSMTEWLIAAERVYAIGLETAVVEVYDDEAKTTSLLTIPVAAADDEQSK